MNTATKKKIINAINFVVEILSDIADKYEKDVYVFEIPDPVEFIKFRMEEQNLKQQDLVKYIGNKSKVSEILSKKRALSLSMIRNLASGLDIPLTVLLKQYNLK